MYEVESSSSLPAKAFNVSALSNTERVKYATVSILVANAPRPNLEILDHVGLRPTKPAYEAGFLTESPVSLPIARGTIALAHADAEPHEGN